MQQIHRHLDKNWLVAHFFKIKWEFILYIHVLNSVLVKSAFYWWPLFLVKFKSPTFCLFKKRHPGNVRMKIWFVAFLLFSFPRCCSLLLLFCNCSSCFVFVFGRSVLIWFFSQFFTQMSLHRLNFKQRYTWKFLLMSVFLSDSICLNFDRSPLIWLSILMIYWKSLCVRRFSTSIDCDMFCTFWKEWNSTASIFLSTRLKCPPCTAAQQPAMLQLPKEQINTLTSSVIVF